MYNRKDKLSMFNNKTENRLIHRIDKQVARRRANDVDSMTKPFKLHFQKQDNRNVFEKDPVLRQYFCFHGKAKFLKGTKYGCNKCG